MNPAIQEIDRKIEAIQADLVALRRARAVLNGDVRWPESNLALLPPKVHFGVTDSAPALAYKALREAGRPLHSSEIVTAVSAKGKHFKNSYLVNAIYRSARRGKIFKLNGGGNFSLLEWG